MRRNLSSFGFPVFALKLFPHPQCVRIFLLESIHLPFVWVIYASSSIVWLLLDIIHDISVPSIGIEISPMDSPSRIESSVHSQPQSLRTHDMLVTHDSFHRARVCLSKCIIECIIIAYGIPSSHHSFGWSYNQNSTGESGSQGGYFSRGVRRLSVSQDTLELPQWYTRGRVVLFLYWLSHSSSSYSMRVDFWYLLVFREIFLYPGVLVWILLREFSVGAFRSDLSLFLDR